MATYVPLLLRTPTILTNGAVTVYTPSGATTGVIRTLTAVANSASKTFTFSVGADAQGTRLFDAYPLTANVPVVQNLFQVVTNGVNCQALASANAAVALGLSGYEYSS